MLLIQKITCILVHAHVIACFCTCKAEQVHVVDTESVVQMMHVEYATKCFFDPAYHNQLTIAFSINDDI